MAHLMFLSFEGGLFELTKPDAFIWSGITMILRTIAKSAGNSLENPLNDGAETATVYFVPAGFRSGKGGDLSRQRRLSLFHFTAAFSFLLLY